jgi:spore germination protein YaaH
VRTDDGYIGYIPVKELKDEETQKVEYKSDEDEYTHITMDEKISLVWNQIYNQTANSNLESAIANVKGVNVISPTWFSIADKNGNLSTLADLDYVENAHKNGMQVWALYHDMTNRKVTKKVLKSTTTRQKLVKNIMFYTENYELDGVNIDFEYITKDIADDYLQFLRELSIECRKAGVVLSIDNYAPSEWSEYFDREQQMKLADYLIIMNYDEHTAGSTEAGSVSSLTYAEKSIKDTIEQAKDASRIINGMPFYTRAWKETPQEESDGSGVLVEDAANGNYYLDSEAISMTTAEESYKSAGVKPSFDETTGQNFVTYSKGKTIYSIWLEDVTSVKSRLELMKKYELAGAAYWSLGQEKDSIWDTIEQYFK